MLMVGTFSFAQKKELKIAQKAIKNSNYSEAKTALSSAEALMSSMDEKSKSLYYLLKSKALYAGGTGNDNDIKTAFESLEKVSLPAHQSQVDELKQNMLTGFLEKGNEALEKKDFKVSSKYFEKAYRASTKDTIYLFYSASTAVNGGDYDRSLGLYEELKELGYTGIVKKYYATNVETNKEEPFNDKTLRDFSVKSKSHIKPTERNSASKLPEIVKNIALIYIQKGDSEKALGAIKLARKNFPDDVNLLINEANVYYQLGNNEMFSKLLAEATQKDPNNAELFYNLGVISSQSDDFDSAMKYYKRAVELKPDYVNALINMAALTLDQEHAIVDEMNGLGSSAADDKKYDELKVKRQQLYLDAIPFLESALKADPKNIQAAKTLLNIYNAVDNTEKSNELKAIVEAIEAGN
ncbi:tetratricopeptide repeat protein [Pontimicrobium sp. IMCC45349]|uniref:tetratricopeptide repeat protein n=1 Tax=Pontimicrobium sp. IMCC45349 TaxID=3391574 RepID=UPI00399F9F13